ncbi:MAG: nucleotide exchange factor GrpE [Chloroflexi bacterium]|nr:nucleotide exchange factor GrpE [Chloroflexota bacterium]
MSEEKVAEATTQEQTEEQADDELVAAQAQAAEYLDQWRRTAAEFSNYRKRKDREVADAISTASADVIKRLLPVLDDFDRAFKALPDDLQRHAWLEGFRLIERKFKQVLDQAGVTVIETVGQRFDPTVHESAALEESDREEGTILEEYRKGYRLGDKVLRPAMVKVAQRASD